MDYSPKIVHNTVMVGASKMVLCVVKITCTVVCNLYASFATAMFWNLCTDIFTYNLLSETGWMLVHLELWVWVVGLQ